jgi:hypothetical protein
MNPKKPNSDAEAPQSAFALNKVPLEYPEDGIYETYANVVNANWTYDDVRLRFAELIQVPDEDRPNWENQHGVVMERAAITLPWRQVKLLRDLLDGIVKNYEEINGELKPLKLPAPPATKSPQT